AAIISVLGAAYSDHVSRRASAAEASVREQQAVAAAAVQQQERQAAAYAFVSSAFEGPRRNEARVNIACSYVATMPDSAARQQLRATLVDEAHNMHSARPLCAALDALRAQIGNSEASEQTRPSDRVPSVQSLVPHPDPRGWDIDVFS